MHILLMQYQVQKERSCKNPWQVLVCTSPFKHPLATGSQAASQSSTLWQHPCHCSTPCTPSRLTRSWHAVFISEALCTAAVASATTRAALKQLLVQLQSAACRWRTFQGLSHKKGQKAKLQLSQKLVPTAAIVLLQHLIQHGRLVQVHSCELLGRHACHLHRQPRLSKGTGGSSVADDNPTQTPVGTPSAFT